MLTGSVMVSFLKQFDAEPFSLKLNGNTYFIGEGEPRFSVTFHKEIPLSALTTSTSLALGEAYMDGDLEVEGDLYAALAHFMGQMGTFSKDETALKKLIHSSMSKKNQQKEVQSHYDIGNGFYKLWLDETMSYSCAYFSSENDTLLQAQENKADRILKKLYLKENMSLLDIGCGWGYLLIKAAKEYGVRGVGITLSQKQYDEFQHRITEEHLENLLTVCQMDYRDLPKMQPKFDRIVSVGMVEHVGRENYPLFMNCAQKVLKPGGLFLLHFISGLKEYPGDPWLKKYIFPGGVVPSLREIVSLGADEGFHTLDIENLRQHYQRTLLCWRENFKAHEDDIRRMFDDRFVRMWDLYLSSCAATFHNGVIDLHQILFANGLNNDLPIVRWY